MQKVYIHIHSKTKLCSVKETISVIHIYSYMNNVFLHLIYYFCTFLFRRVWRKRTQKTLHLSQRTVVSEEGERHKLLYHPVNSPVPFFVKSSLYISRWGFWLPLQCPSTRLCLEAMGAWCFINLSRFIMPYTHCKAFWTNIRESAKISLITDKVPNNLQQKDWSNILKFFTFPSFLFTSFLSKI